MLTATPEAEKVSISPRDYRRAAEGYIGSMLSLLGIPDLPQARSSLERLRESMPPDYIGPCNEQDLKSLANLIEEGNSNGLHSQLVMLRNYLTSYELHPN